VKQYDSNYIGGRWEPVQAPGAIDVHAAASGGVIARVPASGADEVDRAVAAARQAFDAWAALPGGRRAGFLKAIADGLAGRADELARIIAAEVGMPLKLASRIQVGAPVLAWQRYAAHAEAGMPAETVGHSRIVREPAGVVGCITPWNYPLHQITAKVAAALAAGCTVVLKPSEVAPGAAYALAEVVHAAGLPAGVFNLVMGAGPVAGEALAAHPDVDMVSFTGSTRAGSRVAAVAAATVKRVALELGGKSASVVLDDAKLVDAVKATVGSCFLNSGQTCSALTRLIVPAAAVEEAGRLAVEFAGAFRVGDPLDPATRLGPLASREQQERVRGYIGRAAAAGLPMLCGGPDMPEGLSEGYYVRPTVFGPVPADAEIAREEVFGPVLCILAHQGDDDAVRLANASAYGLAAAVWSGDPERALAVAGRLRAGQVDVNGAPFNLDAPFGGYGHSGYGRENGVWGLHEFMEIKSIQVPA